MEQISKIHIFLKEKKIICLQPIKWDRLYQFIKKLKKDTKTKIPLPFILTGWWGTNMEDKRQRFLEQIDICISLQIEDDVLNFLKNLKDYDFIYEGQNEGDMFNSDH